MLFGKFGALRDNRQNAGPLTAAGVTIDLKPISGRKRHIISKFTMPNINGAQSVVMLLTTLYYTNILKKGFNYFNFLEFISFFISAARSKLSFSTAFPNSFSS